jgi:hypothetical protein
VTVCAANCSVATDCVSGCCAALKGGGNVCAPATNCAGSGTVQCTALDLIAADNTFLGNATSNMFDVNSPCDPNGLFGSQFGIDSIYNPNGLYGSQFGVDSAYNQFSTTPPALVCHATGQVVGLVSKNAFLPGPPIDPDSLCAVLAMNGF